MAEPHATAVVIFDTRWGNTAHAAEALADGLKRAGNIDVSTVFAPEVTPDLLESADLVVIGGPTEYFRASAHIRELFSRIGGYDLRGKLGFAFDTHAAGPLTGSAARTIERDLRALHLTIVEPRATAVTVREGGAAGALGLAPGTAERFRALGAALAKDLVAALAERRAHPPAEPTDTNWT